MIIFDLRCAPQGHVFEAWFGSTDDYEDQRRRGLVQCPICGAGEVDKAPMAPRVGAKGSPSSAGAAEDYFTSEPEAVKAMLSALASAQREMLRKSEHVGDRFAQEARAIHFGDAAVRAIHGRATRAEAETLLEEGIPVAPLPFAVQEPGTEN